MAKNSNINRVPNEEMGRKYRSINRPPDLIHNMRRRRKRKRRRRRKKEEEEEEEEGGGERSF
jgi:hypothetical protein